LELSGKTAFVTGGTRGIGRQVAEKLAALGCNIAVNYFRSRDAAKDTVSALEALGVKAGAYRANIGRIEKLQEVIDQVAADFGQIDIFVSNAALGQFTSALEIDEKAWDLSMRTNAQALLFGSHTVAKHMPDGGKIVTLSSLGSVRYIPGYAAIGVSKAAVETLTRYLAYELAERRINVNTVSGGFIDTDALKVFPNYESLVTEVERRTPFGRMGTADEMAEVVVFLCTDRSRWITGQVLVVDGGYSLA
jgi:enoyl-[acyl-carrier protein] reductase III